MKYKGKWRLNSDHDLELTVTDAKKPGEETLTLKGEIVDAGADELLFVLTSGKKYGVEVRELAKLSGKWQADESNRLSFLVSKESGEDDVLVFAGAWEVGKDNEIIYRYKKTKLKRKTKQERALIFKGFWRITEKERLAYLLDTSGESGFLFKAQLESPSIVGKKGALQYKVGIGISQSKRPVERVIKFLGTVKYNLTKKDQLVLELIGSRGRELGATIELNKKILGGEAFMRFKKLAGESKVETGIKFKW